LRRAARTTGRPSGAAQEKSDMKSDMKRGIGTFAKADRFVRTGTDPTPMRGRARLPGRLAAAVLCAAPAAGAFSAGVDELARAAQNPVASMVSVPFQYNANLNLGPDERTQHVLNIQPVVPFSLNSDWNLITRTIVPVISTPGPGGDRIDGIGDIQLSLFLSPARPSTWIWGAGVIAQMRTASDDLLGQGKWAVGPTAVLLHMDKASPWAYGALFNYLRSVGGDDDRPDVDQLLVQPFVNYNFPKSPGRYLSFSPIITSNREAPSGEKWTVPLGLSIGQIMKFGQQPVNLQAGAYYNVERPTGGANWNIRLQVQFMFPK